MTPPRPGEPAPRGVARAAAAPTEACVLAAAFRFAHDLFRTPDAAQWAWLNSTETRADWVRWTAALEMTAGPAPDLPDDAAAYETEFIAAFEAGVPNAPVPLIESHYNRRDPVPRLLHENILFYRAFGLQLKDSSAETSDHLRHQLEFVAWLLELEADLVDDAEAAERRDQLRRGRAEYAARHLLSWVPRAVEKAEGAPRRWTPDYLKLAACLAELAAVPEPASA